MALLSVPSGPEVPEDVLKKSTTKQTSQQTTKKKSPFTSSSSFVNLAGGSPVPKDVIDPTKTTTTPSTAPLAVTAPKPISDVTPDLKISPLTTTVGGIETPQDVTTGTQAVSIPTTDTVIPSSPTANIALNRLQASAAAANLATAQRLGAREDLTAGAKTALQATQQRDALAAQSELAGELAAFEEGREGEKITQATTSFDNLLLTKLNGGVIDINEYINDASIRTNAKTILGANATEQDITSYIMNSFQAAINTHRDSLEGRITGKLNNYVDTGRTLEDALVDESIRKDVALLNGITDINSSAIDDIITAQWGIAGTVGIDKMIQNMILNVIPEDISDTPGFKEDFSTWAKWATLNGFLVPDDKNNLVWTDKAFEHNIDWPWSSPDGMFNYTTPNGIDLEPGETVDATETMDIEGNGTGFFAVDTNGNKVAVTQGDVMDKWQSILNTDPMVAEDYLTTDTSGKTVLNKEKFLTDYFSDKTTEETGFVALDFIDNITASEAADYYTATGDFTPGGDPIVALNVKTPDGKTISIDYNSTTDRELWAAASNKAKKALTAEEYVRMVTDPSFRYDPVKKEIQDLETASEDFSTPTVASGWDSVDLDVNWKNGGKQSVGISWNKGAYDYVSGLGPLLNSVKVSSSRTRKQFNFNDNAKNWITSNIGNTVNLNGEDVTIKGITETQIATIKDASGGTRIKLLADAIEVVDSNGNTKIITLGDFNSATSVSMKKGVTVEDDGSIVFG